MEIKNFSATVNGVEYAFQVVCNYRENRSGFVHEATILRNGDEIGFFAKVQYYNRTWESYEYQSVCRSAFCNLRDYIYSKEKAHFLSENGFAKLTKKREMLLTERLQSNEYYNAICEIIKNI